MNKNIIFSPLEYIKKSETCFPFSEKESNRKYAELIIIHVARISKLDIYLNKTLLISEEEKAKIDSFSDRVLLHEPIQYILGETQFRELNLKVTPGVLIPRPETELLVEKALQFINDNDEVLDIGTGSGAIALSIAKEKPKVHVTAVDVSDIAVNCSQLNAKLNNILNVQIFQSDLYEKVKGKKFNIIISNPPYVTEAEYINLDKNVKEYEPKLALTSGNDGLDCIKKIIEDSLFHLNKGGYLFLEIGCMQGESVRELLLKTNFFANIQIMKDLNGLNRIAMATTQKFN